MHKWSLSLHSKELENEFKEEDNNTNFKIIKIITFVVVVGSVSQLGILFLKSELTGIITTYYSTYCITGVICLFIIKMNIRHFNGAVMLSICTYALLIAWSG